MSVTPAGHGVSGGEQTQRTKQRQYIVLRNTREFVCGSMECASAQQAYDVLRSTQADRKQLLLQAKVHYNVKADEAVAFACNLQLTNEQVHKLRLWTKKWNLPFASERTMKSFTARQITGLEVASDGPSGQH